MYNRASDVLDCVHRYDCSSAWKMYISHLKSCSWLRLDFHHCAWMCCLIYQPITPGSCSHNLGAWQVSAWSISSQWLCTCSPLACSVSVQPAGPLAQLCLLYSTCQRHRVWLSISVLPQMPICAHFGSSYSTRHLGLLICKFN